jgi:hypothetical protein
VKLHARDVLLSKKILYSMVAVPALWLLWGICLYLFTSLSFKATLLFLFCCPFFSYLGVMAVEAGMMDIKDFRPIYNRLFSQFREDVVKHLPQQRLELQAQVRALVRKYGPQMEGLYFSEDVTWDEVIRQNLREHENESESEPVLSGKDETTAGDTTGPNEVHGGSCVPGGGDGGSKIEEEDDEEDDEFDEQRVSNIPAPNEDTRRRTASAEEDESPFSLLPAFSISLGMQNTDSSNDFMQEYMQANLKKHLADTPVEGEGEGESSSSSSSSGVTAGAGRGLIPDNSGSQKDLSSLALALEEDPTIETAEEEEEEEVDKQRSSESSGGDSDKDPYVQIDSDEGHGGDDDDFKQPPDESKKDK